MWFLYGMELVKFQKMAQDIVKLFFNKKQELAYVDLVTIFF